MFEDHLTIHTDGGARGNPGPAASAFVVEKQGKEIYKRGLFLGSTTNNVAEYQAVVIAFEWLIKNKKELSSNTVRFFIDSQLIVNQLNGLFKVKDAKLRELVLNIRLSESKLNMKVIYQAIPREENKKADLLVNETLDQNL